MVKKVHRGVEKLQQWTGLGCEGHCLPTLVRRRARCDNRWSTTNELILDECNGGGVQHATEAVSQGDDYEDYDTLRMVELRDGGETCTECKLWIQWKWSEVHAMLLQISR